MTEMKSYLSPRRKRKFRAQERMQAVSVKTFFHFEFSFSAVDGAEMFNLKILSEKNHVDGIAVGVFHRFCLRHLSPDCCFRLLLHNQEQSLFPLFFAQYASACAEETSEYSLMKPESFRKRGLCFGAEVRFRYLIGKRFISPKELNTFLCLQVR